MKVAIIINELNVRGGTHKQVLRLCEFLKKENIDFQIYTKFYVPSKTYEEFQQMPVNYLYKNNRTVIIQGKSIIKCVQRFIFNRKEDYGLCKLLPEDIDIVNVHDCFLEYFIRIVLRKGKRVIWQINDMNPVFQVGNSSITRISIFDMIQRKIIIKIARKVHVITVNVTKNAERVKHFFGRNAVVLYCGVDQNNNLEKHKYSIEKKEYNLLTMGVFFPYRNYETLVLVIDQLKKSGRRIRLDIIGDINLDKKYSQRIIELIKELKLEDEIKVWGQVDNNVYIDLFNKADIFAFINIDQSWGLAVFEAMSCGIPTIVSNSVGAVEILENEYDSIIVDPMNVTEICRKIERLMEDSAYYNKISCGAFEKVKDFTWDRLYSSKVLEIMKKYVD